MEMNAAPPLFEHGILTENSDIRAHVSFVCRTIYVFRTKFGADAVRRLNPNLRTATQPGAIGPTAKGWPIPVSEIEDIRRLRFQSWDGWARFDQLLSTSEKGKLAVECVTALLKKGRFPLWVNTDEDDRQAVQVKGTDIIVFAKQRIQVKCDAKGGDTELGGTGNLFLQHSERNPFRRY